MILTCFGFKRGERRRIPGAPEVEMTFDDIMTKAAGYLQLGMYDAAWNEIEELPHDQRVNPKVLSLRLCILKGLEKWEMGSDIARGAVKAFPGSTVLYVMGEVHIRKHKSVQEALGFFSGGETYLSGEGWFWCWLRYYQCQCRLLKKAKISLAKAIVFDEDFRELARDEDDLEAIRDEVGD